MPMKISNANPRNRWWSNGSSLIPGYGGRGNVQAARCVTSGMAHPVLVLLVGLPLLHRTPSSSVDVGRGVGSTAVVLIRHAVLGAVTGSMSVEAAAVASAV